MKFIIPLFVLFGLVVSLPGPLGPPGPLRPPGVRPPVFRPPVFRPPIVRPPVAGPPGVRPPVAGPSPAYGRRGYIQPYRRVGARVLPVPVVPHFVRPIDIAGPFGPLRFSPFFPLPGLLPFNPFLPPPIGKRSVEEMPKETEMPEKTAAELEKSKSVSCRWNEEESVVQCDDESKIRCDVEPRFSEVEGLSLRLPALILRTEIVPAEKEKTCEVINLFSQRSHEKWSLINPKTEKPVVFSMFSDDKIDRQGFYVKNQTCFDRISNIYTENMINGIRFSLNIEV